MALAQLCGDNTPMEEWPYQYRLLCQDFDARDEGLPFLTFLELLHDGSSTGGYQSTAELFLIFNILSGQGRVVEKPPECPEAPGRSPRSLRNDSDEDSEAGDSDCVIVETNWGRAHRGLEPRRVKSELPPEAGVAAVVSPPPRKRSRSRSP
eukprot:5494798-Alexandrium_andersonii.AAC.1